MTDPIADLLNRIKNAQAVAKPATEVSFSNVNQKILEILEKEGFIGKIEKKSKHGKKIIEVGLKYESNGSPLVSGIKRASKPSQRLYLKSRDIRKIRGGYGLAIVSTPKGLMTGKEARKSNLGGEIICEVW